MPRQRDAPRANEGSASPAAVPAIAGLDSVAGLRRVAGNTGLYLRLLRKFADNEADAGAHALAAIQSGDLPAARHIAHTVKGVAGNVGLLALEQSASALERALGGSAGVRGVEVGDAAAAMRAQLAAAVGAINQALAPAPVTPPSPGGPRGAPSAAVIERAAAPMVHLALLLAENDGNAMDYLLSHEDALRDVFAQDAFAAFAKAVDNFEFDAALDHLRGAARTHNIVLGAAAPQA